MCLNIKKKRSTLLGRSIPVRNCTDNFSVAGAKKKNFTRYRATILSGFCWEGKANSGCAGHRQTDVRKMMVLSRPHL